MHQGVRPTVIVKPKKNKISLSLNDYQCLTLRHVDKFSQTTISLEIRPNFRRKLRAVLINPKLDKNDIREKNNRQHPKTRKSCKFK